MESTIVNKNIKMMMMFNLIMGSAGLYLWWIIYHTLPTLSSWLTYSLFPIETGSHLGYSLVREVIGVDASVEKVSDMMQIASYGVFGTPSVIIDNEVKCTGKVPKKNNIKAWLTK